MGWIRDPESGIREKLIADPGIKKALDPPGCGYATMHAVFDGVVRRDVKILLSVVGAYMVIARYYYAEV
jgi:hypothetical protein